MKRGPDPKAKKAQKQLADGGLFSFAGIMSAADLIGAPPTLSPLDKKADAKRDKIRPPAAGSPVEARADLFPGEPVKPAKVLHVRDYQQNCEDKVFLEWVDNRGTLVVMATGLGKTVVSTRVCDRVLKGELGLPSRRFLFLAHRTELIDQAYDTFQAAFPGRRVEVEKGQERATGKAEIVIATNQTLGQRHRLDLYPPDWFAAICQDEAHHASAANASYNSIFKHFRGAKLLGLTATPDRKDEAALGQTFDSVAFTFDIVDGVREGWLVPVGQRLEIVKAIDFSKVSLDGDGEFTEAELAEVMRRDQALYALADAAIKYSNFGGKTRSTLVFAASREHAIDAADILNAKDKESGGRTGKAAAIHYKLDPERRAYLIDAFKAGELRYLTNYGILTEGFDADDVRVIVNGRPIKSNRALFAQMVGRATRPLKEIHEALANAKTAEERRAIIKASRKPGAMVVDLCGVNHKLVLNMVDLLGGRYTEEALSIVRDRIAAAGEEPVDVEGDLEKIERKIAEQKAEERRKLLREKVIIDTTLEGRSVDPFNLMDTVSARNDGMRTAPPATPGQRKLLLSYGLREREVEELTKRDASRLIESCMSRKRMGLCTYRQADTLKRFGYDTNIPFEDAKKIIDAIAANGWKPISL